MAWWSPRALPEILEADENHLSAFLRPLLAQLYEQLRDLDTRIRGEEAQLHAVFKQQEACQRLAAIVAAALGLGAVPTRDRRQSAAVGDQQTG